MFQRYGINFICRLLVLIAILLIILNGCAGTQSKEAETQTDALPADRYYTIDRKLDEQLLQELSNSERVDIILAASDCWVELMQQYYDALLGSTREGIAESTKKSQSDWEEYYNIAFSNEEKITTAIYGTGSTRSIALAKFDYETYRSRALELYQLCLQAGLSAKITPP